MRIVEARNHRPALGVNHISRRSTLPQDFIIRTDSADFAVFDSKRLGKRRHSIRRDSRVVQYTVGLHVRLLIALWSRALHLKSLFFFSPRRRYHVLGKLGWRRAVDHGVRVLDACSVCAVMALHDVHDRVICVRLRPVALPFEHHGK
jgi:hypothetical protein